MSSVLLSGPAPAVAPARSACSACWETVVERACPRDDVRSRRPPAVRGFGEPRRGVEERFRARRPLRALDRPLERGEVGEAIGKASPLHDRHARHGTVEDVALGAEDRQLPPLARVGLALEERVDRRPAPRAAEEEAQTQHRQIAPVERRDPARRSVDHGVVDAQRAHGSARAGRPCGWTGTASARRSDRSSRRWRGSASRCPISAPRAEQTSAPARASGRRRPGGRRGLESSASP